MKKKKDRNYIIREMIKWMNLKSDFCDEIIENYDNYKLKNLKMIMNYEYNDWDELMSDEEWEFNEEWNNYWIIEIYHKINLWEIFFFMMCDRLNMKIMRLMMMRRITPAEMLG